MSINAASSSNVTIGQNEWDATGTIVNRYSLNGVEGDLEDILPAIIPDIFENQGIIARKHFSNVAEHGFQPLEGTYDQLVDVPDSNYSAFEEVHQIPSPIIPQSPYTAAQETVLPKSYPSLYWDMWRKVWDSHVESWINSLEDPTAATCGAASDALPISRPTESNIITFDSTHEPASTSHVAPACTSRVDVPVGPSRQETGLPHSRNTPYRDIRTQHNTVPHHSNEHLVFMQGAYSVYCNATLLNPPFGETEHQNTLSENEGHEELNGSGFPPVEPTSTRSAGSLDDTQRSEPRNTQGNGRSKRKGAPSPYNRVANEGEKPAERVVRIDKYGNEVYQGMRPDKGPPKKKKICRR
ncbi:hypothetical protein JR316_0005499 [Psilocybe cubensis]|uniref:Uncharacterized protein n=1 Tax=Psilocybe cubensis TaxID=181762 RepID=A0ACB8GZD4_PSICU|nr:hypothetical protein JR316_0005499 [Psilocybe cubensis]KAH9480981.1 hypothetical protein JR316_0005499 [Psilocybe cubensis]